MDRWSRTRRSRIGARGRDSHARASSRRCNYRSIASRSADHKFMWGASNANAARTDRSAARCRVARAAEPLLPRDRGPFLEALAQALAAQPLIGDGTVHRAIADTQRCFFEPPQESGFNGAPKHRGSKRC
jgi:hypothetical protein